MRTLLAAGFIVSLSAPVWGQVAAPAATPARNPFAGDPKAITQGAVLFRQECVFCHGVAARGGMRGPDLTTGSWSHGGGDADLVAHDQRGRARHRDAAESTSRPMKSGRS